MDFHFLNVFKQPRIDIQIPAFLDKAYDLFLREFWHPSIVALLNQVSLKASTRFDVFDYG